MGFHSPVLTLRCKNYINMKTKTKKPNPLGACGADNNSRKLYEVNLHSTVYYERNILVGATSEEEAKDIAERCCKVMNDDEWNMVDHDMFAFEAKAITEGGRHV